MRKNIIHKIDNLPLKGFVSKYDLGLDMFSIEPTISKIRKILHPKEFKTVSKHLVRIK